MNKTTRERFLNVRISVSLLERASVLAREFQGVSTTAFVDMCLTQMLDLIETEPHKRQLPRVAAIADAVRATAVAFPAPSDGAASVVSEPALGGSQSVRIKGVRG